MKVSTNITIKMFVGCQISAEMRMHLSKSKEWSQESVSPIEEREANIQNIHFQGKDYFGFYLLDEPISIAKLKQFKITIHAALKNYCPEYNVDSIKVYVLPQIFVA